MADDNEDVKPNEEVTAPPAVEETSTPAEVTPTDPPVESVPPGTGTQEDTPADDTPAAEVASEPPKPQPKHGQRASNTIRGLKSENKQLKAKLAAMTGTPEKLAPLPAPSKPEDTPEYWADKARNAPTEQDRQEAIAKWQVADRQALKRETINEFVGYAQRIQKQQELNDRLVALQDRAPFLKENDKGSIEIDVTSPYVQRAAELATARGVALATPQGINWEAIEYFVKDAALEILGNSAGGTAAALAHQKVLTVKAQGKTALETSSAPGLPKPSGQRVDLEKEIRDIEAKVKKGPYNQELNRSLLTARQKLHKLTLRPTPT